MGQGKKLRILQVNKAYYPTTGGIERVVQQIAEGLKDTTDMKVLVCQAKGKTKQEVINGVPVCRSFSIGRIGNLPLPLGFTHRLKKMAKDADVLLVHLPFPFADLACLLSGYKGKIVIWWHSDVVRQKTMLKLYKPIMKRFLERADAIFVATKGHINGSAYLKPYREKCVLIPFGVEREMEQRADDYISKRKSNPEHIEANRTEETLCNRTTQFLFVGRLVYYKGCGVLLNAFRNVTGATLTLVGDGPLEEELKLFVKQNAMEDRVNFLGHLAEEELSKCFAECDVFVLPSTERSEAFGLVQIEAMAYEKPVINTMLPSGVPEVSLHQVTGLTVQPKKVEELAAAMQWMVEHPEERKKLGQAARERMKKEFQLDIMLKRVENELQNVIGGQGL